MLVFHYCSILLISSRAYYCLNQRIAFTVWGHWKCSFLVGEKIDADVIGKVDREKIEANVTGKVI